MTIVLSNLSVCVTINLLCDMQNQVNHTPLSTIVSVCRDSVDMQYSFHFYVMSCYCDCVVHSCVCQWYFLTYHSSNWFIVPLFPGHLSHTLHAAGPESRRLLLPPLPKNDGWGKGKVTWQVHVDWGYTIWRCINGSFFLSAVIKWSGM